MSKKPNIGRMPLRVPRARAGTFRPYVKSNQPSTLEFENPSELVVVPKRKDEGHDASTTLVDPTKTVDMEQP